MTDNEVEDRNVCSDISWRASNWAAMLMLSRGLDVSRDDVYYMHKLYNYTLGLSTVDILDNQWILDKGIGKNLERLDDRNVSLYIIHYNRYGDTQILMKALFRRVFRNSTNEKIYNAVEALSGDDALNVDEWGVWKQEIDLKIASYLGVLG